MQINQINIFYIEKAYCDFEINSEDYKNISCTETFKSITKLTSENQELLIWRSEKHKLRKLNLRICDYHENYYLKFFVVKEKYCCDPYKTHLIRSNYRLSIIDLEMSKKVKICQSLDFQLMPGKIKYKNFNLLKIKDKMINHKFHNLLF